MSTPSIAGVEAFLASLNEFGASPTIETALVIYTVIPPTGVLAGTKIRTGVSLDEVAPWPTLPPHWIHLPAEITLHKSNIGGSPRPGWVAHSRDIRGWGTATLPVAAWLAHVRGVLGDAK